MHVSETLGFSTPFDAPALLISDAAAERINHLKNNEKNNDLRFRIGVKGGGCSGFQYEFSLDASQPTDEDNVFRHRGAEAVVDDTSLELIKGSTLDYTQDLAQSGFFITNPAATARCVCGNSFSV